jgi:glycosyltransferase involved in cell wall biosynthesis
MRTPRIKLIQVTTAPQTLGFFPKHIDYLKERGFDIHLVSSPGEYGIRLASAKEIPFHPIPMSRAITPSRDFFALLALQRVFRRIRPDIVHSHTPKAGLLGSIAARIARVPIVFLSQFGLPQMTLKGGKRKLLDGLTRISCALADKVWIDSPSMREYVIRRRLCPAAKAVTIGNGSVNGVDAVGLFSPEKRGRMDRDSLRYTLGIPKDAPVLGYVGRIVRDKGMHELALAWKELKAACPDLRLLIIGDLEDKDPILPEDRALFESDPSILMPGFSTDIPRYMAAMDVFVMPSYREGFGVTNIEAAAMELPVVSTRIPGCVDSVKDGETGLLVPPGDAAGLAKAIKAYLDSPELRAVHGAAGRQRVLKEFRPETIWNGLYEEYRSLLRLKGVGRGDRAEAGDSR